MPVTPAEVRAVQFATTRMRTGYDMDEVDAFLDILEADVAQYVDELQRVRDGESVLRAQCDQLQGRVIAAEHRVADVEAELVAVRQTSSTASVGASAESPAEITAELEAALSEHPDAASVLAIAQRTADEIIRAAQSRADAIQAAVRAILVEQQRLLDS